MNLCAVSIDLDEIHHYERIHGLPSVGRTRHAVYDLALRRAGAWAGRHDIPLTFFAVGQDLSRPASASALQAQAEAGHTVENHSLSHRYDLTRLTPPEMLAEVQGGAEAIGATVGRRPVGFRAPGYVVTDELFDALEASGVEFDSSVMSSPPYFCAKAAKRALLALRGRPSASIQDRVGVLRAPRCPYRPGRRYYERGERRLVELPIGVTPVVGVPLIGTSLSLLGRRVAPWLMKGEGPGALWNIELHGIDFLGSDDGLERLVGHQPELGIALATRMATLDAVVQELARGGAEFISLADAARRLRETC